MTNQHPLTDDKCYELWSDNLYENEKMRAAADWQLDQVITAWEQCLESPRTDIQDLLDFGQKLKAMRPTTTTTQENNND